MGNDVYKLCIIQYKETEFIGLEIKDNLSHDQGQPSLDMLIGIKPLDIKKQGGTVYLFAYGKKEFESTPVFQGTGCISNGNISEIENLKVYQAISQSALVPRVYPDYLDQFRNAIINAKMMTLPE